MEKPPAPKQPAAENAEQYLTHPVEDVVAHGREICEQCKLDPHAPGCEPDLFHKEIESSEVGPLFQDYENGKLVTLKDIRQSVARVVETVSGIVTEERGTKYGDELEKKLNLLKQRDLEIQRSVGRYVETLVQFFRIKHKRGLLEAEDFVEKMGQIDKRRRQAHDSLIDSLKIYSTLVQGFVDDDLLEGYTVVEWGMGQEVPDLSVHHKHIVVFAPTILSNRDLIKDWAISAELNDMMQEVMEAQTQQGK